MKLLFGTSQIFPFFEFVYQFCRTAVQCVVDGVFLLFGLSSAAALILGRPNLGWTAIHNRPAFLTHVCDSSMSGIV